MSVKGRICAILAASLFLFVSAAAFAGAAFAGGEKTPAKVNYFTNWNRKDLPVVIAKGEGFFKDEQLEVEINVGLPSPVATIAAFNSGEIDFLADNGKLLKAAAKGKMNFVYRAPMLLSSVGFVSRPGFKVEDAKGKEILDRFSTDDASTELLRKIFRSRGLGEPKFIYLKDAMSIIQLVKTGKKDFGLIDGTYRKFAEEQGLKVLINYAEAVEGKIYIFLTQRRNLDPEVAERFMRAYTRAQAFIFKPENKEKVVRYLAEAFLKKNYDSARKMYEADVLQLFIKPDTVLTTGEIQEFAKLFGVSLSEESTKELYVPPATSR